MNKTDAAKRLGVTERTLQRYMARYLAGEPGGIRFHYEQTPQGETAMFEEDDIEAFKRDPKHVHWLQTNHIDSDTKPFVLIHQKQFSKMLLTVSEAAVVSGLPLETIAAAINEGELRCVKIKGGLTLVRPSELETFVASL